VDCGNSCLTVTDRQNRRPRRPLLPCVPSRLDASALQLQALPLCVLDDTPPFCDFIVFGLGKAGPPLSHKMIDQLLGATAVVPERRTVGVTTMPEIEAAGLSDLHLAISTALTDHQQATIAKGTG
jgi:hypothetical protein